MSKLSRETLDGSFSAENKKQIMQKIITIAALLSAGTAFSNAETYTWTGNGTDAKWYTQENWTTSSGEVPTTIPDYKNTNDDVYVIGNGSSVLASDVSVGNLGATLKVGNDVTLSANWDFVFKNAEIGTNLVWTGGGDGLKWATESATSSVANSLSLDSVYSVSNSIFTTLGAGSTIDFGSNGRIVLSGSGINAGTAKKYTLSGTLNISAAPSDSAKVSARLLVSGKNIWYRDVTTENGLINLGASSMSVSGDDAALVTLTKYDFVSSKDAAWTLNGTETGLSDLTVGAYRFYATEDDGIGVQYLTAVPEPSAFGLITGAGALALAASRRRRKA